MAKTPKMHRQKWTAADNRELKKLVGQNTPTRVIGIKMGRSEDAVYGHASNIGLSLKPANRSPRTPKKR